MLAGIHAAFRATDPEVWPEAVRASAWALPWTSVPLMAAEDGTLAPAEDAPDLPAVAPGDLMPKLAIKSWRDAGRLRVVREGAPLDAAVASLIAGPTWQQRLVLRAWLDASLAPALHLSPWRAVGDETRYLAGADGARHLSTCLRADGPRDAAAAKVLADTAWKEFGQARSLVVQMAYDAEGAPLVVDVNPGLTLSELRFLEEEGLI